KAKLEPMLAAVLKGSKKAAPSEHLVQQLLRLANALRDSQALATLLDKLTMAENGTFAAWQFRALAAASAAMEGQGADFGGEEMSKHHDRLAKLLAAARQVAKDSKASFTDRAAAIRVMGREPDHWVEDIRTLTGFLTPQTPPELQTAAVATLGRLPN